MFDKKSCLQGGLKKKKKSVNLSRNCGPSLNIMLSNVLKILSFQIKQYESPGTRILVVRKGETNNSYKAHK